MLETDPHASKSLFPSRSRRATGILTRGIAVAQVGIAAALVSTAAAPAATLTLSATNRQSFTGWGMFPGYAHSNWGGIYQSVANRYIARDRVFELAANYIRIELASNTYNTSAPNNLDPAAMTQLVSHLQMAKGLGVSNWMVSVWSPPAVFKNPQYTSGEVNGVTSYFNTAYTTQFCQYYAGALSYLQQNGCGAAALVSIQNEPNQTVSYDGCSYTAAADYLNIISPLRTALNNAGLTSTHIGADEPGQPGDPSFFSSGSNYWGNLNNYAVDDAIVHTYGGAGWDHYQFSLASKTHWMTEWCDISGANQITASVNTATHIARDVLNDGVQKWFWWNSYNPGTDTPGSADLVYGSNAASPKTTLAFHLLKRLFREVTPDGSFSVRSFASNDTDFNVGFGSDYSKPVNVIGFVQNTGKTVVLLANTSSSAKTVNLAGLGVSSLECFQASSTTSSSAEMDDLGPISVSGGTSASFAIAPNTVQLLTSAPSVLPMQYEAESLSVPTYSGPDFRVISDATNLSQGAATMLDSTAAGNYLTFTVPKVAVAKYDVRVGIKTASTRGIVQLAIGRADNFAGTQSSVGAPIDEYSATQAFKEVDLGTWTPGTSSDKWFQFKITGKNASSTGYDLCIDYILLRPQ